MDQSVKVDMSSVKPTKHVSFTSSDAVKQICDPFLKKHGLNAFSYSRVFPDGSRAELWTNPLALEHTFIVKDYLRKVYSPDLLKGVDHCMYELQVKKYDITLIDQYEHQLADQRELFNHDYCYLIVKRHVQYTEYFIFYAPKMRFDAINIYLGNYPELDKFTNYFLACATDLIKKAVADKLIPPWREVEPPSRSIGYVMKTDPLSPKERQVAFLMVQSKSAKEIAMALNMSPKTAERHIFNIKNKLEVHKKSNLVNKLFDMGFKPL